MRHGNFGCLRHPPLRLTALFLIATILCFFPAARADWHSERQVAPGVKHIFLHQEEGPWVINILQASRSNPSLSLSTLLARGRVLGNAALSTMVSSTAAAPPYAVAAINGDYFRRPPDPYVGDPFGLQILQGELVSFPYLSRSALFIGPNGSLSIERSHISAWATSSRGLRHVIHGLNQPRDPQELVLYTPRFGASTGANSFGVELLLRAPETKITPSCEIKAQITAILRDGNTPIPPDRMVLSGHGVSAWFLEQLQQGEEITISLRLEPDPQGVLEAIGGGPRLLREGKVSVEAEQEDFNNGFATQRHPRTAVGYSDTDLFFVTVDGRQPGRSEGMTLYELANLLLKLGAKEALNLDGGGSTEMLVQGQTVNYPSDGGERQIANALALYSNAPAGALAALRLEPSRMSILASDTLQFSLRGQDYYGKRVEVPLDTVVWKVTPAIGSVNSQGEFVIMEKVDKALSVEVEGRVGESPTRQSLRLDRYGDGAVAAKSQVQVYPLPASLEVIPSKVQLRPGQGQQFIVEGKSADGKPIPPLLLHPQWSCPPEIGTIDPPKAGYFRAGEMAGEGPLTATLGNVSAQATVVIGTAVYHDSINRVTSRE